MKKLTLKLDELQVETFATEAAAAARAGTVQAHNSNPTDAICTECCWYSGTDNGASDLGDCDSYWCGDDRDGPSHAPSCGATCNMTGTWKCADGCGTGWEI